MNIEHFFGEEGPLAQKFKGYVPRPQQIELASAIEESMQTGRALLGEAPTGVGKSLAALVPAFRLIKRTDAPVVIVTSSILLQEQYFYKDIPLLEELMGMNVSPVLLKGKSNYLCVDKLLTNKASGVNSSQAQEVGRILDWAAKTKKGDVSELDFNPSYSVWSEFAIVDQHECAGKECPLFNQCHYYNNRRKMAAAKLIVCNYHYYFTALKSEGMLPPGVRAVIFDEGHEIPGIARDMEEKELGINTFVKLNKMLAKAQKKATAVMGEEFSIADEIELMPLLDSHQRFFMDLTKHFHTNKPKYKDKWVIEEFKRHEFHKVGSEYMECLEKTEKALSNFLEFKGLDMDEMGAWEDEHLPEVIDWQFALMRYHEGIAERVELARRFIGKEKPLLPYDVLNWVEETTGEYVTLRSKPFSAVPITQPIFEAIQDDQEQPAVPIVMSATLSVNKSFDHLKTDLGIESEVNEVNVDSPFDLTNNMLWYLPSNIPAGNEPQHLAAVMQEMERIIRVLNGRTLCLFTSIKSMQIATDHLRKILPSSIQVITQADMTKKRIIEQMQADPNTVVVATKSFFTGVDIQGQNLSAVLIDKIPFPMIGDPINDYLMATDRGFFKHTLPETIITMKQGFGRLNRTVNDKGVVAVFDGRLSTSGYKNRIFNSFDFQVTATRDFERVKEYLEEIIHVNI